MAKETIRFMLLRRRQKTILGEGKGRVMIQYTKKNTGVAISGKLNNELVSNPSVWISALVAQLTNPNEATLFDVLWIDNRGDQNYYIVNKVEDGAYSYEKFTLPLSDHTLPDAMRGCDDKPYMEMVCNTQFRCCVIESISIAKGEVSL